MTIGAAASALPAPALALAFARGKRVLRRWQSHL